ncbi:MAG: outer membrane protein assembly factor BamA [Bacteroidales bacterium]|nr:outer membrane protein assembly factor BamA [Bacteroidales bacterium]
MKQARHLVLPLLLIIGTLLGNHTQAQVPIGNQTQYDIDYLTPKQYEIGGISFENADNYDSRMILLVAGLQVGDKIKVPGDRISAAIDNLWKQGMFEDVQIAATRIQGDKIFLKIALRERPKMSAYTFKGVKRGDDTKLKKELNISAGDVVTENMLQTSVNKIRSNFIEKGYNNVQVDPLLTPDTTSARKDRVIITFDVKLGKRVKIDSVIIAGNEKVNTNTLLKQMKNTHDVRYFRKLYFWTPSFWKRSKYREAGLSEDLEKIITYYNEHGYRDARIVTDTVYNVAAKDLKLNNRRKRKQDRLNVKIDLHEGAQYYFRNITFSGNTVYDSETLSKYLRIKKGDPYNRTQLETNLTYNPSGTDISSLYMDNGYLFFNATPVETGVYNDSIDIEIRIIEGKQAYIRNVSVEGNTITNDHIIMRELHTRPGDLFSRDALIRSRRELATLRFFKEESIIPDVKPNREDGTVDIVYKVEEGNTSQIQLQGGYGGGMWIGTVGLQLNNFSVRNIFHRDLWAPLPAGDGQQLSINASSNGKQYGSVNVSFTEPWLGGHRPQSLNVSGYLSLLSNALSYKETDPRYSMLRLWGANVSLSKRLKWPDDYFYLSQILSYKHYNVIDPSGQMGLAFEKGVANDLSYGITLGRNSFDSPYYTRSGSEFTVAGSITPPYSVFNDKDYSTATEQEKYRWIEYYKVNVRGSWVMNIVGDVVVNTRFRFGFMGHYNDDIGTAPFGRYYVGGDGLSSWMYDGREIIPLRGYTNNSLSPSQGASVFDRFTVELRQPIIESAASTIWVLGFVEAGNSWAKLKNFQPFEIYPSAGLGVRLFIPLLGLIGVDWGYGFKGTSGGSQFHFSIGQSID